MDNKIKTKTSNPSTKRKSKSKLERDEKPFLEGYRNINTWRTIPANAATLREIGLGFIEWAQEAIKRDTFRGVRIEEYFARRGVGTSTVKRWRAISKEFDEMYRTGKEILGAYREKLACYKLLDKDIFLRSAKKYDPEWGQLNKDWVELNKKEEENRDKTIIIEMSPLKAEVKNDKGRSN